jgi:serine/threonine-protein kinase
MATVYLARDLKHDRPVALKVLHPELAHELGPERFLREIRIAAGLRHPNILPVHDSGAADGLLWYTMPYVAGESLRGRLDREAQLPLEEAIRIAGELADALGYAHHQGILHRDIKPENILLAGGHCVIADFGLARALEAAGDERLTVSGLAVGTPAYMSPEQASSDARLDGRSDLYSLGCVIYEMLAGEPPFTGRTAQAIIARRFSEPPPLLRTLREVPERVEQVVMKALARTPADRFATTATFGAALAAALESAPASAPVPKGARWRGRGVALTVGGSLLALAAGVAAYRSLKAPPVVPLDPNLVAIAPFDVLDASLQMWREGMVDVLARDLDGAGALRTVSPTTALRRWHGRADPASATSLARRTGAGLAVFGSLAVSGRDSIRLRAGIVDAKREQMLGEFEVGGPAARMDPLTDALAVGLLRQLGRTRPVAAVRHAGVGTASLPALKAFLQAEQHYRRGAWDSARVYAELAVEFDTSFALAYKRLSQALGFLGATGLKRPDSLANMYAARAGALNHGLAPRDSMLVLAESLTQSLLLHGNGPWADMGPGRRLSATVEDAVQRNATDPEAWDALGEMRHHFGGWLVPTHSWRATLDAFERSITLDPLFAPAYIHPVELSLSLGDTARARRYATTAIRSDPFSNPSRAFQLILKLLADPRVVTWSDVVDTLPEEVLLQAYSTISRWTDSAEISVVLARQVLEKRRRTLQVPWYLVLAQALACRGHLREAVALRDTVRMAFWADPYPEAALLGAVPAGRASAVFASRLHEDPLFYSVSALPWWAGRRDSAMLRRFLNLAHRPKGGWRAAEDSIWAHRLQAMARANLARASGDTSAAIAAYGALLDVPCPWWCQGELLAAARLLVAAGRLPEAARILNAPPTIERDIPPRPPTCSGGSSVPGSPSGSVTEPGRSKRTGTSPRRGSTRIPSCSRTPQRRGRRGLG